MDAVESGEVTSLLVVVVALVTPPNCFTSEVGFGLMDDCFSAHSWYRSAWDRMLASPGFVREVLPSFPIDEVVWMVILLFERLIWSEDKLSEVVRMTGGGSTSPKNVM